MSVRWVEFDKLLRQLGGARYDVVLAEAEQGLRPIREVVRAREAVDAAGHAVHALLRINEDRLAEGLTIAGAQVKQARVMAAAALERVYTARAEQDLVRDKPRTEQVLATPK
jgi:hypothetical protein